MDNLNKTISFILGLVVVIVFIAVITGKLNLRNKLQFLPGSTSTVTPTEAVTQRLTAKTSPVPAQGTSSSYNQYQTQSINGKTPSKIPSTGSPTLLLPLLLSGIGTGFLFRRFGKKARQT